MGSSSSVMRFSTGECLKDIATYDRWLVSKGLGAEDVALLDGLVGVFLVPEAGEPSTPGATGGGVHGNTSVSEGSKRSEPANTQS